MKIIKHNYQELSVLMKSIVNFVDRSKIRDFFNTGCGYQDFYVILNNHLKEYSIEIVLRSPEADGTVDYLIVNNSELEMLFVLKYS